MPSYSCLLRKVCIHFFRIKRTQRTLFIILPPYRAFAKSFIATISYSLQTSLNSVMKDWAHNGSLFSRSEDNISQQHWPKCDNPHEMLPHSLFKKKHNEWQQRNSRKCRLRNLALIGLTLGRFQASITPSFSNVTV